MDSVLYEYWKVGWNKTRYLESSYESMCISFGKNNSTEVGVMIYVQKYGYRAL